MNYICIFQTINSYLFDLCIQQILRNYMNAIELERYVWNQKIRL